MATPQSLFRALHAGRRDAKRTQANMMPYKVYRLKKNGDLCAAHHRAHSTEAEAVAEAKRMNDLNPGSNYVVVIR
jgi:hypothetical protein